MIGQLLDRVRDYYIDYFIDTIIEYAETNGGTISHEVALCKADGRLATAGVLGLPVRGDLAPIRDWFIGWFQEEDSAEGELLGGVHFLSDPETGNAYSQVSIDLGTAPVESFEELLDALGQMGATKVQFGLFEDHP